eukprot:365175-Chlamydomonas_euryale.AAC.10
MSLRDVKERLWGYGSGSGYAGLRKVRMGYGPPGRPRVTTPGGGLWLACACAWASARGWHCSRLDFSRARARAAVFGSKRRVACGGERMAAVVLWGGCVAEARGAAEE